MNKVKVTLQSYEYLNQVKLTIFLLNLSKKISTNVENMLVEQNNRNNLRKAYILNIIIFEVIDMKLNF